MRGMARKQIQLASHTRYHGNMKIFRAQTTVGTTARVEAFSDAFMAIIITLLVLEIRVPELHEPSAAGVLAALRETLPEFLSFAFSFLTLSVFWVNHHHFFHELHKADWRLLWHNSHLLFWLALIPFTTAFLGAYPGVPSVATVYCFVLFMAALAFVLMSRHAMFVANLLDPHITKEQMREHYRHGWTGVACYALATALTQVALPAAAALMLCVPLYFIVPRLMHDHESML